MSGKKLKKPHNDPRPDPCKNNADKETHNRHVFVEPGAKIDLVNDLKDEYHTTNESDETHNRKSLFWTRIAAIFTVLYFFVTGLIYLASNKSAKAAESAANTAHQVMLDNRAIYRPFLVIENTNTFYHPADKYVSYEVVLINASDIGATGVLISCDWFFNGTAFPDRSGRFKAKQTGLLGGRARMTACVGEVRSPLMELIQKDADLTTFIHGRYSRPGGDEPYPYCEKLQYDKRFKKFVSMGGCDPYQPFPQ